MRERKTYPFEKLRGRAAKDTALEAYRYYNVEDLDWWDITYDDAKNIGLEITEFDDYRAKGKLVTTVKDSVEAILKDYGEICDTYKLALEYQKLVTADHCTFILLNGMDEYRDYYEESEDLQADYLKAIVRLYHKMLMDEYQYLMSDQAIKELLQGSDYKFYSDGTEV